MGRLTWSKPDGSWGIKGVDLAALPPAAYGAMCKLKDMEKMVETIRDPDREEWEKQQAMEDLMRMGEVYG